MKKLYSFQNLQKIFQQQGSILILLFGFFLRFYHLIENRSLWLDESYVALEISKFSLKDILFFTPFGGSQAAPPMFFLLFEKIFTFIGGNNEYSLRALPFLASIASLYLMYLFCEKYVRKNIRIIILAVFAFSDPLIYYAAEVKPYATDLLFSLILLVSFSDQIKINYKNYLYWSIMGGIAIFFSFPSIFLLASLGSVWFFRAFKNRRENVFKIILIGFLWVVFFGFLYTVSINPLYDNNRFQKVLTFFSLYPPDPFTSLTNFQESISFIFTELFSAIGIAPALLWFGIFCIGVIQSFKTNKQKSALFLLPVGLTLLTAFLHKYPFIQRFLIFLIPCILFFLSEGIAALWQIKIFQNKFLKCLLIFTLFISPLRNVYVSIRNGREKEDIRGIMKIFKEQHQENDAIFINRHSLFGFGYYHGILGMGEVVQPMVKIFFLSSEEEEAPLALLTLYCFNKEGFLDRQIDSKKFLTFEQQDQFFSQERTWVILSHISPFEHQKILKKLNDSGTMKKAYVKKGAYLYLFDLTREPSAPNIEKDDK